MEATWHGAASFSLRVCGREFLFDPYFSTKNDYADWYIPNDKAPEFERYFAEHDPDYVFISHGHFDHFDLETVKRIARVKSPVFIGNPDVTYTIKNLFGVGDRFLVPLSDFEERELEYGFTVKGFPGIHWNTGEEGRRAAEKLNARPDRYGVVPCGGSMLGCLLNTLEGRVYYSGDTRLSGIPKIKVDYLFLNIGGLITDPKTKQPVLEIISDRDAAEAISRLKPSVVCFVHYDSSMYLTRPDFNHIKRQLARLPFDVRVVDLPYNRLADLG